MQPENPRRRQALVAGAVVAIVLSAQELYRALFAASIATGGAFATVLIIATSGLAAGFVANGLMKLATRKSTAAKLAGQWQLKLHDSEGVEYRAATVDILFKDGDLQLQGTNVDAQPEVGRKVPPAGNSDASEAGDLAILKESDPEASQTTTPGDSRSSSAEPVAAGENPSTWSSLAAWVSWGRLIFLYEISHGTAPKGKGRKNKRGVMILNINDVRKPTTMQGNWYDYQPAGLEGYARWSRDNR